MKILLSLLLVASTAFAQGRIVRSPGVNAQTGATYTYLTGDFGWFVTRSNVGAMADTLPRANSTTFHPGWVVDVQNLGAGTLTITPITSTINGAATLVLTSGQGAHIVSNGTNYSALLGGGSGGGGDSGAANYSQSFTSQTSVALAHSLGTINVLVQCRDASDQAIDWDTLSITSSSVATVTFASAQSGRCIVNGSGGASGSGVGRYATTFAAQTSLTISGATHGLGTADVDVVCYDAATPRNRVEPDTVTVNSATESVVISFFSAQSGRCIIQ